MLLEVGSKKIRRRCARASFAAVEERMKMETYSKMKEIAAHAPFFDQAEHLKFIRPDH